MADASAPSSQVYLSAFEDITVTTPTNDFEFLSFNTQGSVDIVDANDVTIFTTNTASDVEVSATDSIRVAGDITTTGGNITLNTDDGVAAGGDIIIIQNDSDIVSNNGDIVLNTDDLNWSTNNRFEYSHLPHCGRLDIKPRHKSLYNGNPFLVSSIRGWIPSVPLVVPYPLFGEVFDRLPFGQSRKKIFPY